MRDILFADEPAAYEAQYTWIVKMINHVRQFPTLDVYALERVEHADELDVAAADTPPNNAPVLAAWYTCMYEWTYPYSGATILPPPHY
jgi:hypothetical protein